MSQIITAAVPSETAITISNQIYYYTPDSDGQLRNYSMFLLDFAIDLALLIPE